MATATVTNTFVAATTAAAADVNLNFSDLVTFLNASVVHVDGTKAMTGPLNMGSQLINSVTDPASAQDAATKAYCDALRGQSGSTDVAVADGGTGASTASAARDNLGLGLTVYSDALGTTQNMTSASASDVTGLAVTGVDTTNGGVLIVSLTVALKNDTTGWGAAGISLNVNSSSETDEIIVTEEELGAAGSGRSTYSKTWILSAPSSASYTIKPQVALSVAAGQLDVQLTHSEIQVLAIADVA